MQLFKMLLLINGAIDFIIFFQQSNIAEKADIVTPIPTYTPDTQLSQATPTQATPTQNTYQSTQESQLNDTDPIYPELLDCELSVEKIVPQLTSSIW